MAPVVGSPPRPPCGCGAEASQPSLDPALRCSHAPCSASTGRMPSPSRVPFGARGRPPEDWADAIFRGPPLSVRALFAMREVLVRLCGIEAGDHHVFDLVAWSPDEVLLGIDQRHLAFRASVLVQPDRVVRQHRRRGAQSTRSRLLRPRAQDPFLGRPYHARSRREHDGGVWHEVRASVPDHRLLRPRVPDRVVSVRHDLPDGRLRSRELPSAPASLPSSCLPASAAGSCVVGSRHPGLACSLRLVPGGPARPRGLAGAARLREPRARRSVADVRAARRLATDPRRVPDDARLRRHWRGDRLDPVRRSGRAPPVRPGAGLGGRRDDADPLAPAADADRGAVVGLGIVGNAGFAMVTLLVFTASGGRWSLVAVWHASLNAVGGMFFFTMVTGVDKARLGVLLSGAYVGACRCLVPRRQSTPPLRRAQPGQQARRGTVGRCVMTALEHDRRPAPDLRLGGPGSQPLGRRLAGRAVGPTSHRLRRAPGPSRPADPGDRAGGGSSRARLVQARPCRVPPQPLRPGARRRSRSPAGHRDGLCCPLAAPSVDELRHGRAERPLPAAGLVSAGSLGSAPAWSSTQGRPRWWRRPASSTSRTG